MKSKCLLLLLLGAVGIPLALSSSAFDHPPLGEYYYEDEKIFQESEPENTVLEEEGRSGVERSQMESPKSAEDHSHVDEQYKIPEEEFFAKFYPPKNKDGSIMTQAQWEALYADSVKEWEVHQKRSKPTRPVPLCVVGDFEDDGAAFIEAGCFDQPKDVSGVLKADKDGKAGPLEKIEFFSIVSPAPDATPVPGIGRLNQWMHIVVHSNTPLEGFFIQGIQGPLGLPFGEFRDDFDCTNPYKDISPVYHQDNRAVPCSYRPLTVARHPFVFFAHSCGDASCGKVTAPCDNPRSIFRVHFHWDEYQCNFVPRLQFLIIAVESFSEKKFSHILTTSYEHTMDSLDGVAYPYYGGWEDGMTCNDKIEILVDGYAPQKLTYSTVRSPHSILIHYDYDECVQGIFPPGWHDTTNTCPPGPLRCTPKGKGGGTGGAGGSGGAGGTNGSAGSFPSSRAEVEAEMMEQLNETSFNKDCPEPKFCPHPMNTELVPKRKPHVEEPPSPDEVLLGKHNENIGPKNAFIKKCLRVKKNAQASHGHLMILSCLVLWGVGAWPARFLKETLGIDPTGQKGMLSVGRWVWIHVVSMIICIATLWIGVSYVINIQDKPRIPCSEYTKLGLTRLVNSFASGGLKIDPATTRVLSDLLHTNLSAKAHTTHKPTHKIAHSSNSTHMSNSTFENKSRAGVEEKDQPTPLSDACDKTETAILIHSVVGIIAVIVFHVAFFGGFLFAPDSKIKAGGHMILGYVGQFLALLSIFMLLGSGSFCFMILVLSVLLFIIPHVFTGLGHVVQKLEDKSRGISGRRKCVTNEGIEVPILKSKWTIVKAALWVTSCGLQFGIYIATFFLYISVYDLKTAKEQPGGFHRFNCPGFKVVVPSWKIDSYILTDYIRNPNNNITK